MYKTIFLYTIGGTTLISLNEIIKKKGRLKEIRAKENALV